MAFVPASGEHGQVEQRRCQCGGGQQEARHPHRRERRPPGHRGCGRGHTRQPRRRVRIRGGACIGCAGTLRVGVGGRHLGRRNDSLRQLPSRDRHLQQRHGSGAEERGGQEPVTERGALAAQHRAGGDRDGEDHRHLQRRFEQQRHRDPSLRAFSISPARRSSSSSESRAPSPPSSALTAFSVEPSKKVSTRWRSAERRAAWRGTAGA